MAIIFPLISESIPLHFKAIPEGVLGTDSHNVQWETSRNSLVMGFDLDWFLASVNGFWVAGYGTRINSIQKTITI